MTAAIRMSSSGTCGCLPHLEFREIGLSFSFTLQKRGEGGGTKKEQNCNNNNFDIVWFETSGRGMKSWPSSQGKKNEWILLFTFINGWWFELPLRLSMSEFMMTCSTDFSGTSSPPPVLWFRMTSRESLIGFRRSFYWIQEKGKRRETRRRLKRVISQLILLFNDGLFST